MNAVIEAIEKRRSVRSYQSKPVPMDIVNTIIDAGNETPSAMNSQPWRFVVIENDEVKKAPPGRPAKRQKDQRDGKRVGVGKIRGDDETPERVTGCFLMWAKLLECALEHPSNDKFHKIVIGFSSKSNWG
ncbi:MAG: nitroreductase family protein [Thermodesulfovibrionales bacterium]